MTGQTLDETIRLTLKTAGFEKAEKQFKLLKTTLGNAGKMSKSGDLGFTSRMKLQEKESKEAFKGIKKRLNEKSRIIKKQEKEQNKALNKRTSLMRNLELQGVNPGNILGMDNKQLDKLNHKMKLLGKESRSFKMHWLGIMFAGMALDRVMTKLIRNLADNYKMITGDAMTPLNKSIIMLRANFKFLQYSLVEVSSGLLTSLFDGLTAVVKFFSKQDPALLKGIGIGILAIAGAAKIFLVGGQFALAWNSFKTMLADFKLTKLKNIKNSVGDIGGAANSAETKFNSLSKALGAGLILYGTFKTVQDLASKTPATFGEILADSLTTGVGAGLLLYGMGMSALGATGVGLIAAGAIALVMTVDSKKKKEAQEEIRSIFLTARNKGYTEGDLLSGEFLSGFGDELAKAKANQEGVFGIFKDLAGSAKSAYKSSMFNPFEQMVDEQGNKVKMDFSLKSSILKDFNEFQNSVLNELNNGLISEDEAIIRLEDYYGVDLEKVNKKGEELSNSLIQPSIEASEELVESISENGGKAFTVELTEAVKTFLTDDVSGMAALQLAAEKYNETISQPITKKVTINETRINSSINLPGVNPGLLGN